MRMTWDDHFWSDSTSASSGLALVSDRRPEYQSWEDSGDSLYSEEEGKSISSHPEWDCDKFLLTSKVLGGRSDSKLSWNPHVERTKEKAINCIIACRSLFGKKRDLKPFMFLWLYKMVIRPMVTYASVIIASLVWWNKLHQVGPWREISKIQRLICVAVAGAVRSAPTIALEALLDLRRF